MKTFTKIMAMVLALALTAALSVGLTTAYLTDTDEDVNVMTLGNVSIEQHEYERVVENGAWVSTGETDKYGYTPDKVQPFTQAKPLYPAVFADGDIKWDDRNGSQDASGAGSHQQSWGQVSAPGFQQLFDDSVKNVQDKFVFVKNTGKSDAYVRTFIALEQGAIAAEDFGSVIMTNGNFNHWKWEVVATDVEIDGNTFYVLCATYLGPTSNPTGILAPGAVSYASLLQVYMRPEATNADVEAIDGNNNGTYDILVLSQAVQTAGFGSAAEALKAGFGDVTADKVQEWFGATEVPVVVSDATELADAIEAGESVVLSGDIVLEETVNVTTPAAIDLNGYKLTVSQLEAKADTTISNGEIAHGKSTYPALSVSAGTLTLNEVTVTCAEPCNIVTSGSAQAAEYAALEIWSGKCILNDCDIVAKATELRYSNSIFAVGIHSGELTMNGGSITVESEGSAEEKYNFEGAVFAGSAGAKTVNLNDVKINIGEKGKLLFAWGGNTVVNTTDAEGSWTVDKVDARNGGTYEINYVK